MEIAFLFALVLLNGAFAMSEIALVAARKGRLQTRADAGDRSAALAIDLGQEPTRFLSAIQIGITSISILNGIVGDAVLSRPLAQRLRGMGVEGQASEYLATAIVVLTITYFSIVLGELVPKRLGQMNPEGIARLVARPINWLAIATKPFVKLLTGSTHLVLAMLRLKEKDEPHLVEEEIHALLAEGTDAGVIEHAEHDLVRNVFRLDDRQLGSLMVPRGDIVHLDVLEPWSENQKRITAHDHSRFPVARGGLHDIVGIVSARVLLASTLRGEVPDLATLAVPPVFVPETLNGIELLDNFRALGDAAFVVDEYGEVVGMVTITDLIEAITGEFKPRNAEDAWAIRREDGSWLLDGLIPIPELKDRLGLAAVPEEERARYHTLSGMMLLLLGKLPRTGDIATWEDWRLEIVDIDGMRIDKVLAMPTSATTTHFAPTTAATSTAPPA
ncbi:MAG TPA: hemolysin family protein [Usitatibacter sp.]|nr:hemolysin family protein [Usitatibacter sp.]